MTLLEEVAKFLVTRIPHPEVNIVEKFDYIHGIDSTTDISSSRTGEVIKLKTLRYKSEYTYRRF